jgi:hypothetical protein
MRLPEIPARRRFGHADGAAAAPALAEAAAGAEGVATPVRNCVKRSAFARKAALASPAMSAACITFVLPSAKSNWREAKILIRGAGAAPFSRLRN